MYAVTDKQQQRGSGPTPKNTAGRDRRPADSLDILQRHAGNAYLANAQSGLSSGEWRIQREVAVKPEEEEDQGPLQRASIGPSDMEDWKEDEVGKFVQAKRVVGPSDDIYEQEADRVAEQVVANKTAPLSVSSVNSGRLQRQEAPAEKTDEEKLKEGGENVLKAALKTNPAVNTLAQIKDTAKETFFPTWQRGLVSGGVGAVLGGSMGYYLYNNQRELPIQPPDIPLNLFSDSLNGFSVGLTYNGPVNAPTDATITFKYAEQPSERRAGNNSGNAAEMAMLMGPGSAADYQRRAQYNAPLRTCSTQAPGPRVDLRLQQSPLNDLQMRNMLPASLGGALGEVNSLLPPGMGGVLPEPSDGQLALPQNPSTPKSWSPTSQTNEPLEQEADRVAGQVLAAPANPTVVGITSSIQRYTGKAAEGAATAPASVDRVLSSSGKPLEPGVRQYMEPRFGHDFSHVRVHTGDTAEQSAREVNAHAYTAGHNIVFGSGRFEPETHEGRRLLAHELTHVVQQRGGAPAQVRRTVAFGSMYRGQGDKKEYVDYRDNLPETKASSEVGGYRRAQGAGDFHAFSEFSPITPDELLTVFKGVAQDIDNKQGEEKSKLKATIDSYVEKLNQSFKIFKIDTVEAQASYIANAYHESVQFRYMTETQMAVRDNKPYESDPKKVRLNTTWLDDAIDGTVTDPDGTIRQVNNYERNGSINAVSDWQQSFIGRGPIQVTHDHNYLHVLAVMEKRAEELEKVDPGLQDAKDLREAIDKIKMDPREAANPKYAFMFSAAFMKMPDTRGVRGDVKATQGHVTDWMGPQPPNKKREKMETYKEARDMLMVKWIMDQDH